MATGPVIAEKRVLLVLRIVGAVDLFAETVYAKAGRIVMTALEIVLVPGDVASIRIL